MSIEMEEMPENDIPSTVQCPECEHNIPVDPDWQEGDIFSCPNCSTDVQVTGLDPLWVDFAPESEQEWGETEETTELSLDEVEEMEEEEEGGGEGEWSEAVSHRVSSLRPSRPRPRVRKEKIDLEEQDRVLLTPEGAARLQKELDHLQKVRLPKVTTWLSEALSEGFEEEDVTELEEARSELSFIEGRIRYLENLLSSAEYLREPESKDSIQMGSRVTVAEGNGEPETYRIVTPAEADPLSGFISYVSPLGRALMGHQVDEIVLVKSPDGPIEFRIVGIL